MPKLRASQGGAYERRGSIFLRVTVAAGKRHSEAMPWVSAEQWGAHGSGEPCPCAACERARHVQELVNRLREVGQIEFVEKLVESAAAADAPKMAELARAVDGIVAGKIVKARPAATALTFRTFAERWTDGELHRDYPDHVREKRSGDKDVCRLEKHVYPVIGDDDLANPNALDRALEVMRKLPEDLSPASRRHVAQLMTRVYSLAVYPCRLLAASPLPRGFLPKLRKKRAKAALYPDEDAKILAARSVPLVNRMLYGFLAREGMRSSEALRMTWSDLDLERGAVKLDKNKTDDPRAWALDAGTAEALRRWKQIRGASDDELVFGDVENRGHLADVFRAHLPLADVTRPELFEDSDVRHPVRLHDLRATFVTVALASGRSESWVTARTGHRSSTQIATYRRTAETFAELGASWFAPMATAIPELSARDGDPRTEETPSFPRKHPQNPDRAMENGDAAAFAAASLNQRPGTSTSRPKMPRRGANVGERTALGSTVERRAGSSPAPCTSDNLDADPSPIAATSAAANAAANTAAPNPRAAAITSMYENAAALAAAGDLAGARVLHEAIGRMLGSDVGGAPVVELATRRERK